MLKVGMKALIIGARTEHGQQYIGMEVTLVQHVNTGDRIEVGVNQPFKVLLESDMFVVQRDGITSHATRAFKSGYAAYDAKYLMPIPPLEDPGIDECTFTPIVQKEKA